MKNSLLKKEIKIILDREEIILGEIPAVEQMALLRNVSASFYLLNEILNKDKKLSQLEVAFLKNAKNFKTKGYLFLEILTNSSQEQIKLVYQQIINRTWNLINAGMKKLSFFKRYKFKKKFYKKANHDSVWLLVLVNDIYNFWLYVGKQIALLGQQKTMQMIYGEDYILNFQKKEYQEMILKN